MQTRGKCNFQVFIPEGGSQKVFLALRRKCFLRSTLRNKRLEFWVAPWSWQRVSKKRKSPRFEIKAAKELTVFEPLYVLIFQCGEDWYSWSTRVLLARLHNPHHLAATYLSLNQFGKFFIPSRQLSAGRFPKWCHLMYDTHAANFDVLLI